MILKHIEKVIRSVGLFRRLVGRVSAEECFFAFDICINNNYTFSFAIGM